MYANASQLTFEQMVETVEQHLQSAFPGESLTLVGQCLGGALAWALGARAKLSLNKVTLLNPMIPHAIDDYLLPEVRYFFVLNLTPKSLARMFSQPIGQSLVKRLSQAFLRKPRKVRPSRFNGLADAVDRFHVILRSADWPAWSQKLARLATPVQLITAENDSFFKPRSYEEFIKNLPNGALLKWSDGGHLLSVNKPDEVAQTIELMMVAPSPKGQAA